MRFGIYAEMQTAPGKSHADRTWEILRQIEHADQVGFDVYSVIDHHFFQKFSLSANRLTRPRWPACIAVATSSSCRIAARDSACRCWKLWRAANRRSPRRSG